MVGAVKRNAFEIGLTGEDCVRIGPDLERLVTSPEWALFTELVEGMVRRTREVGFADSEQIEYYKGRVDGLLEAVGAPQTWIEKASEHLDSSRVREKAVVARQDLQFDSGDMTL